MVKPENSEEKIAESALEVFVNKGFAGARMQEIADRAGVNKALVNYYYRSKEKLYEVVFKRLLDPMVENLASILDDEADIFISIEKLIRGHFRFIQSHPEGPLLIAKGISFSREKKKGAISNVLIKQIRQSGIPIKMLERIQNAIDQGEIRAVDPVHLIVNIMSMNIMYVIVKPIFTGIFDQNSADVKLFENNREDEIVNLIISSLKNKNFEPIKQGK